MATRSTDRVGFELVGLESSEHLFRALTDHTPVGVFVSDAAGACVYVNERWCELAGLSAEQALGDGWARALHPDDLERVLGEWSDAAGGGRDSIVEYRFRRPDGGTSWIQGFAAALRDGEGTVRGWVGTCLDLTARTARELQQQAVADFGLRALPESDRNAMLRDAVETLATGLGVEYASVLELQADGATMVLHAGYGWSHLEVDILADRDVSTPSVQALRASGPVLVDHSTNGSGDIRGPFLKEHDVASSVAIAVPGAERPFGVLTAHSIRPRAFNDHDLFFLRAVANVVAAALARERTGESARQLAVIVESSLDAIFGRTVDGTVTSWNAAAERLFGYTAGEMMGRSVEILAPPERVAELEEVNERLRRGETVEQFETVRVRKDSTRIEVASTISPITDASGRMVGASAISRDVSERKREEAALRDSEARARAMFESALDAVITMDHEGTIVEFNPSAETMFGYTRSAVVGRRMADVLIPPEAREAHRRGVEHFRATGEARILGQRLEVTALRADGSEFPVELTVNTVAVDGPPLFAGFIRDLSEWKQAEEQLRQSEARYRDLFENATDLIAITDLDSRLTDVNAAFTQALGYSRDELINRPLAELVPPEWHERLRDAEHDKLEHEIEDTVFEHELIAKDGRRIQVEVASRLIKKDGRPVGTEAICRDISERKRLEEQLRQAQKMKAIGQLAGGVAHDFNNLLTVINGYADGALESEDLAEIRASLREIFNAGTSAASLTRQLLSFSRQQVLQPQILDLAELIANVERLLGRVLGEDIVLSASIEPELAQVHADRTEVEQVLLNLAVNAREAMPAGGSLRIEAANAVVDPAQAASHVDLEPGPYVALTITDSGAGMDAQTLAHAFEPFFTTKSQGTGLGLATVYGIVQQSGGHISVDSESGAGTTFRILLPRAEVPAEPRRREEKPEQDPTGAETILLVEDNDQVRALTLRALTSLGYAVTAAASAQQAVELASTVDTPLELIVSDVLLTDQPGPELVERLQRLHPGTKSLFISGYAPSLAGDRGGLGPDQPFLAKPFTTAQLAATVRRVLDT